MRGRLLAVLRDAMTPVPQSALDAVWDEPVQRARALDGLVADGLVEPLAAWAVPAAAELSSVPAPLPRCYTTDGQPCVGVWLLRTTP